MEPITIERMLAERKETFGLRVIAGRDGLKHRLDTSEIHRPGLELAGYTARFAHHRTQVLGESEITYLETLCADRRREHLSRLFDPGVPLIIVTKNLEPPVELIELADSNHVPLLGTVLSTSDFTGRLSIYLDMLFAPTSTIHGTLVDVYGVGLLYTGKSGIGKSEVALDLVERGHRLVADDVVRITRKAPEVISGTSTERLGHHMEVRGIGIINVEKLFGVRSIRIQKRIEVEVRLELWSETNEYERLGVEDRYATILGVNIPAVTIPLSPGKNITVISEVVAMNHMLKAYGTNVARDFTRALAEDMQRRRHADYYLESDLE